MPIGYIEAVNATSNEKKLFKIKASIQQARPQLTYTQIEKLAREFAKENLPPTSQHIENFLGFEGV